ncbi:conserved hypothetical protein [Cupriavidus phytorum]|uniref:Uncharacterized protein n=2 Tax=Cupriavidus TaxID=106589 RepID=A0A375CP94_9BURK|nr:MULTISPECIES: hypothetical protein [Cupriavidus]PZX25987.1 hypothetical protein C7416_10757 [Cupriavidus alkaliphilus]SOY76349.1 conserved hypothetical protein [Cupriavidus taiwanensis]
MSTLPLTLTDNYRTLVLHVLEDGTGQFTWRIVMEERCGAADEDCTVAAPGTYRSYAEAEAACWAAGNGILNGPRAAGELRIT